MSKNKHKRDITVEEITSYNIYQAVSFANANTKIGKELYFPAIDDDAVLEQINLYEEETEEEVFLTGKIVGRVYESRDITEVIFDR